MAVRNRTTLLGFGGGLLLLGLLLSILGVDRTLDALGRADPTILVVLPLVFCVWLTAWGLLLRVVIGAVDGGIPVRTAVLVYAGALFANNVTPFGQAGGEPVSAFLVAEAVDAEYETGLAAIASADAIHFVPSLSFATIGLGWLAVTAALTTQLRAAAVVVGGLAVIIVAGIGIGLRYQTHVERVIVRLLWPIGRTICQLIPQRSVPTRSAIENRVGGFFSAVSRVGSDRDRLLLALGWSALGWIALAASLWLSLLSLGTAVAFTIPLLVVPLGSIASVTPLPGGIGGIESVLAALLVSLGVAPPVAGAAVIIHRTVTYLLPTLLGGGVAWLLGVRSTTEPS